MPKPIPGRFTVYLPDETLLKRLEEIAKRRRRSVSFVAVEAIEEYLDRHEEETPESTPRDP